MLSTTKTKRSKYEIRIGYTITLYTSVYADIRQTVRQYGADKVTIKAL